eukprot:7552698-Pyramimonas_sp.AAC.1
MGDVGTGVRGITRRKEEVDEEEGGDGWREGWHDNSSGQSIRLLALKRPPGLWARAKSLAARGRLKRASLQDWTN